MIEISIKETCIKCNNCVTVCPAYIFSKKEKIEVQNSRFCIECGQCVAICPTDSIEHTTFPQETVHEVDINQLPDSDSLMELLKVRRSNRAFSDRKVPPDMLDKVLKAAYYAPTARNAQSLEYTLVINPDKLNEVDNATIKVVENLVKATLESGSAELKENLPYFRHVLSTHKAGHPVILRNATALMLIHSKAPSAVLDANLAYQNASIMATSLGLAHFYTGYIRIFAAMDRENLIKGCLGIEGTIHAGMALGMAKLHFNRYADRKPQIITKFE